MLPYLSLSPKNHCGRILINMPLYITGIQGGRGFTLMFFMLKELWCGETQLSMPSQALQTIMRQAKV